MYNKDKHISRCIKSILNQTYQKFEVIVVNDGSTDQSLKVVEGFEDTRIRIINQKNQGVSSARNAGILNSKYDNIAFLDADDFWEEKFLDNINFLIEKYPDEISCL